MKKNKDMKQTLEEAAKEYADGLYAHTERGVVQYEGTQIDFKKGAKWALSEVSDYIRSHTSFDDKAWDVLPFIKAIEGNLKPFIAYLETKKGTLESEKIITDQQYFISEILNK